MYSMKFFYEFDVPITKTIKHFTFLVVSKIHFVHFTDVPKVSDEESKLKLLIENYDLKNIVQIYTCMS